MRFLAPCVLALAAVNAALPSTSGPLQGSTPAGFTPLFDGQTLGGWWGASTEDPRGWQALPPAELAAKKAASLADIRAHWRVEDGELVNDGEGLYLTSEREFADFELRLSYRTVAGADSGIYLRGVPQVQIWDTTEAGGKWSIGADKGSGGLWNNSEGTPGKDPLVHADRPFGEWNEVRVVQVGECVTVDLNGQRVVEHARMENYFDRSLPVPRRGPVQLQTHGGEIRWKDVFLREIDGAEANALLASSDERGFTPAFDGHSWAGWRGPVEGYEIVDESIRCRAGSGGTIFTEREFGDFAVRFEFLLPPRGNSGLAIRYPGEGDAAYAGMCELQVLDDSHVDYAELDPRQYHGSIYGQVAALRGYQRPVGEWNFQEVTVRGSRITVELNGTRIVDADVATVTDLMYAPSKFAGRDRKRGHFGFAGHGDAVAYRRILLRELEAAEAESAERDGE